MVMVQVPFAKAAVMLTAAFALAAPFDSHDRSFGSVVLAQGKPFDSQDRSSGSVVLAQVKQGISVAEAAGVYRVTAEFTVPAPPSTVASVLTDYERIPEFMPDVKTSQVLERTDSG